MKALKILILSILTLSVIAAPGDPVIKVDKENGAGQKVEQLCSAADTLYGVMNSMQNVRFPNVGAGGGYAVGVINTSNALIDYCDYYQTLIMGDTTDLIFMAAELANKADDNRHNETMDFGRATFDAAQIFWDPDSGKLRPTSAMDPVRVARGLNSYYRDLGTYYNNKIAKRPNAWDVRTRAQRESDQRRLQRAMEQGAALSSSVSCPVPLDNTDYGKEYDSLIKKHQPKIDKANDLIDFFHESLTQMGYKLNYDEEATAMYVQMLNNYITGYYKHSSRIRKFNQKSIEYKKNTKATEKNYDEPTQKQLPTQVTQEYQHVRAVKDANVQELFLREYDKKWITWTKASLPGIEGRTRGVNKIEDEFKDYNILCNERELASKLGITRENASYDILMKEEMYNCIDRNDVKISSQGGLFRFYVKNLGSELQKLKTSQAAIWTFESKHLGTFRVFEDTQNESGLKRQEVTCAKDKNVARHLETTAKLAGVNADINAQIAKQLMAVKAIKEEELKAAKRERDYIKRQAIISSQKESSKTDLETMFDERDGTIGF